MAWEGRPAGPLAHPTPMPRGLGVDSGQPCTSGHPRTSHSPSVSSTTLPGVLVEVSCEIGRAHV